MVAVECFKSPNLDLGRFSNGSGIDPEVLSLHKDAYSNARYGNGYYDLVSFANRLPSGSDALIGIGPLYYRYSQDRSQAGFQLDAIRVIRSLSV